MLKAVKCIHFLWWWTIPFDLRIRKILCLPGDWIFGFLDYWQCLLPLAYCRLSPAMHPWPSGVGKKGGLLCAWVQVVGDKLLVELLWVSVAAWVSLYQRRSDLAERGSGAPVTMCQSVCWGLCIHYFQPPYQTTEKETQANNQHLPWQPSSFFWHSPLGHSRIKAVF